MSTNQDTATQNRKLWRSRLSYSTALLIIMVSSGTAAGIYSYRFGKEALRGVRPSPPSVKLPTLQPTAPPSPPRGINSR
jgi:hypothetical protein